MNQQEQARIQVLNSVLEYQLPIAQAAEIMGVSERHTKRLLAAYRKHGAAALAHGNRGRRPHNAIPEAVASAVVKLASNGYAGANHTHFTELVSMGERKILLLASRLLGWTTDQRVKLAPWSPSPGRAPIVCVLYPPGRERFKMTINIDGLQ